MTAYRIIAALTIALLAAPFVAAQEEEKPEDPSRPDDAAWVDDCPPDMMCAAGSPDEPTASGCEADACSHAMGPDGCIECSGPVDDSGSSCMDGANETEICDREVQYLDGRGPADCENCRGDEGPSEADPIFAPDEGPDGEVGIAADGENAVPSLSVAAGIVAAAGVALFAVRRR